MPRTASRENSPAAQGHDTGTPARTRGERAGISQTRPAERSVAVGGYAAAVTALTRPFPARPSPTRSATAQPDSASACAPTTVHDLPPAPDTTTPPAASQARAQIELLNKLFDAGCFDAAAAGYQLLGDELRAAPDPAATALAFDCRRRESECLALLGRTGQAIRLTDELLIDCTDRWGPDDDRLLELRHRAALLRRGTGQGMQARDELADLVDDLRRLRGENHHLTRRVLEDLGRSGT
jgi:hypothetical protein